MLRELKEMVVIITGASAGIGYELARQLSDAGARLVLSARREDRLIELNTSLGGNHLVVRSDVSRPEDCQMLIAHTVEHFGRIDTLVCNAGYGLTRPVAKTSSDEMLSIFKTNVFGTTDCIRAAVPVMEKQERRDGVRGQIMIVTSAAARRGLPFFGAYSATKFAQLGISEALRVELKPSRIAVTSVHPVGTETEFFKVAEREGGLKMPPQGKGEVRQSAAVVAKKMIKAIRRPRPEVWPLAPARFMLSFATLFPGLVDRIMAKYRGELDRQNESIK
ncbi:MAG: SDR family NAD(P)-dependent oxidoreductase [Anaerolineae bacterium]|nr:SDR family NAD(P)-dependent oxidoreductase [Phycisphaerae bacterium]